MTSSKLIVADDKTIEPLPNSGKASKEKTTNNKVTASKRKQVQTLEEFVPSEEVSADKPVAFPNDI